MSGRLGDWTGSSVFVGLLQQPGLVDIEQDRGLKSPIHIADEDEFHLVPDVLRDVRTVVLVIPGARRVGGCRGGGRREFCRAGRRSGQDATTQGDFAGHRGVAAATGLRVRAEMSAVAIVMPAEGPSLAGAPSERWM